MARLSATAFHAGKILTNDELGPVLSACPLCDFEGERRVVVRVQDAPPVAFLACPRCCGLSASRMPTPDALAHYYAHYYDRVEIELVTTPKPERLGWQIADRWPGPRQDKLRILDYGGGDGTITRLTADRLISNHTAESVDVVVVDYNQKTDPRPLSDRITLSIEPNLAAAEGAFDIVVASAILEHVPDFRPVFADLMKHAAPGALFYARTPFMSPFCRRAPIDMTFPAHVHDMGAAFWNWLAAHAGVEVEVLRSEPSIVETVLSSHAPRTIAAHALKAPARLLATTGAPALWPFYGGWQVYWRLGRR